MHEMSLAEGVVRILEEEAGRRGFSRVKRVWLEVGRLSHVEPEALRFCFGAVTDGTLAHGAALELVLTPGRGWCLNCRREVEVGTLFDACPACGEYQVQVTAGDEMRVRELEVE